jgi:DNA polymerase III delta prime subunit
MPTNLLGYEQYWNDIQKYILNPVHICLTGSAGCGKTTFINDFINSYFEHHGISKKEQEEWIFYLNGDQDRGIHRIRESLLDFVRQSSKKKGIVRWVIVDDMDTFPELSQQALRRPMELYKNTTCFLFIGNHLASLIPPLRSRCKCVTVNSIMLESYGKIILEKLGVPVTKLSEKTISWFAASSYGNVAEFVHHGNLISDFNKYSSEELTDTICTELCSVPPYYDFLPLLNAFFKENRVHAIEALTLLWFKGFSYEDILESTQLTLTFFGIPSMKQGSLVTRWFVRGWAAYCQGCTSFQSLCSTLIDAFNSHSSFTKCLSID